MGVASGAGGLGGNGDGGYIVFQPILNGVTHQAHLPIFWAVTHLSRSSDKAPRLYDLSVPSLKCLRVGGVGRMLGGLEKDTEEKASRHHSGGAYEGFLRLL